MKRPVTTLENEAAGDITLDDAVFGLPVRKDLLARMVNWQLAKRRQGTHNTKTRAEVRGSTRKLFRQKGTGRARAGNIRVAQRRGGGVVFGPQPRDHAHGLPKKLRRLALKTALSSKASEGNLVVLEAAKLESGKTRDLVKRLQTLGWSSILLIDGSEVDQLFARAARNIPALDVLPVQGANVYDILRRDTLVLTRDALQALEARLK